MRSAITRIRRRDLIALCVVALVASACGASAASLSHAAQQQRDTLIKQGLVAQRAGETTTAAAAYKAALIIDATSAVAHYDLGDLQQVNLGETSAAISNYQMALAAEPTLLPALFNLAILETARTPTAAVLTYRRLLGLYKSDAPAMWNLGYVLVSLGQTKVGENDVAHAIALDPALASRVATTPLG